MRVCRLIILLCYRQPFQRLYCLFAPVWTVEAGCAPPVSPLPLTPFSFPREPHRANSFFIGSPSSRSNLFTERAVATPSLCFAVDDLPVDSSTFAFSHYPSESMRRFEKWRDTDADPTEAEDAQSVVGTPVSANGEGFREFITEVDGFSPGADT